MKYRQVWSLYTINALLLLAIRHEGEALDFRR